jgi:hypothetical protein
MALKEMPCLLEIPHLLIIIVVVSSSLSRPQNQEL